MSATAPATPPNRDAAPQWPESLLVQLPLEVRQRFMARLAREAYGMPMPAILAGVWVTTLICTLPVLLFMVLGLSFLATLRYRSGVRVFPELPTTAMVLVICLAPIPVASIVTHKVDGWIRRRLLRRHIVDRGTVVTLRSCPACAYDQKGTTGGVCPECGFEIVLTVGHGQRESRE